MKKQQIQKQEQLTAYNRKTTHDIFFMTMEWLEKYIEIAGYYPDWENRKQIHNNNIKRLDIIGNPKKTEQDFLTQLFLFWGTLKRNLPFSDELKTEFYQWLNAAKIDNNNCPKRLKHLLYGFNEVLEGRGEKLQDDIENMEEELDSNSPDYMEQMGKVFAYIQAPMRDEAEIEKSLKDKTHKDIKIGKKFDGDNELGKKTFNQLTGTVSNDDFCFFPQKSTISGSGDVLISTDDLDKIVQEIKTNPQNWRVDEIPTEINNFGETRKQEWVLISKDARDDYDQEGKLNFNNNPIYRWENFNSQQRFEIKQAKKNTDNYLTNDEIKWVVREVKENPRVWKIGTIDKQIYLIHGSAQIKRNEIGTLIHSQQKFSEAEWAEINGAFERAIVIDEFKQNAKIEKGLWVINRETGEVSENEDWFIHNQLKRELDSKGYLIYVPNLMIRAKDLTEAEQKELGLQQKADVERQSHQTQSDNRKGGGKGSFGGWGSSILFGSFSVISLIGIAFTKTKK